MASSLRRSVQDLFSTERTDNIYSQAQTTLREALSSNSAPAISVHEESPVSPNTKPTVVLRESQSTKSNLSSPKQTTLGLDLMDLQTSVELREKPGEMVISSQNEGQSTNEQVIPNGNNTVPSNGIVVDTSDSSPKPSSRQFHHSKSDGRSDSKTELKIIKQETSSISSCDVAVDHYEDCEVNDLTQDLLQRSTDSSKSADNNSSSRTESVTLRDKTDSSGRERKESRTSDKERSGKKKSSWYTMLYPTYKSRSDDFKRIFKELPPDERLLVDYSCALQRDILVHGRIYLSQDFLCFYANIFRWETCVTIRFKDVMSVTKEKTALVIPNAIQVCTSVDKFFFTSFGARDKTYVMLFKVWQNALLDQPLSSQELWQWVHACYGDELGLTSEDDDYVPPLDEDKMSFILNNVKMDNNGTELFISQSPSPILDHLFDNPANIPRDSSMLSGLVGVEPPLIPAGDTQHHIPTDVSSSDSEERTKEPAPPPTCTEPHEGKELLNVTLPINIDQLFTLLFTMSKFYIELHTSRKTFNIVPTEWQQSPAGDDKVRQITSTITVDFPMTPKNTQITETQTMLSCSQPGHLYSIVINAVNTGFPYAENFYIWTHYCIHRVSDNESNLSIMSQIKYRKSTNVIAKAFIERNGWFGLEDFFTHLHRSLLVECEVGLGGSGVNGVGGGKQRRRRRRRGGDNDADESGNVNAVNIRRARGSLAHTSPAPTPPDINGVSPSSDTVVKVVFVVLLLLLLLNALLYYKLWFLEQWAQESSKFPSVIDLQILRKPPENHNEWVRLLQQQEVLHQLELDKWNRILSIAVKLLKQAEEYLSSLQDSVHPLSTKFAEAVQDMLHEDTSTSQQKSKSQEL